jgi:hypothetical protein
MLKHTNFEIQPKKILDLSFEIRDIGKNASLRKVMQGTGM